jgi:hypothetical protein
MPASLPLLQALTDEGKLYLSLSRSILFPRLPITLRHQLYLPTGFSLWQYRSDSPSRKG